MSLKTKIKKAAKDNAIPVAVGLAIGTAIIIKMNHVPKPDFTSYGWEKESGDFLIVINGHLHRFLSKPSS